MTIETIPADIVARFPKAKGFATEDRALRALAKAEALIPDHLLTAVLHRPADDRYLPIVFFEFGEPAHIPFIDLAEAGICIASIS